MAENALMELLAGRVRLLIVSPRPEILLNLAMARGIHIDRVRYQAEGVSFSLRYSAVEALQALAAEHDYAVEVAGVYGIPFYKKNFRRRLGFALGMLSFALAWLVLSSLVWTISVSGNHQVASSHIIASAARHGLYCGVWQRALDRKAVEANVLHDIPQLAYAEITIQGIAVNIMVVEKVLPLADERQPANVVARCDGVVTDLLCLAGTPMVEAGQTVMAGDVLISGVVLPSAERRVTATDPATEPDCYAEPRLVHARGTVKARVWYEAWGECARQQMEYAPTGQQRQRWYLHWGEQRYPLGWDRRPEFERSERSAHCWTLRWLAGLGALELVQEQEITMTELRYTEPEAIGIAREQAIHQLRQYCSDAGVVQDNWIDLESEPDAELVRVKLVIEVEEDIGRVQTMQE